MLKTNEQLLKAYKKANFNRRMAIVLKSGLKTEQKYLDSLKSESVLIAPGPVTPNLTIHNVHIVDISGSMSGGKLDNAIIGVNTEVEELKLDKDVIYTQTLVEFDTHIKMICYKTPIADVAKYASRTAGMTALNQAIGETLTRLKSNTPLEDKVLVKIFTDGGENASSSEWRDKSRVAQLIKECEERGFTVTFVGTNFDVQEAITRYGVDASNTLVHDNTAVGVTLSFVATRGATQEYKAKAVRREDTSKGFYKTIKEKLV